MYSQSYFHIPNYYSPTSSLLRIYCVHPIKLNLANGPLFQWNLQAQGDVSATPGVATQIWWMQ